VTRRRGPVQDRWLQIGRRSGLLVHFFGRDGKGKCSYDKFSAFLTKLQRAVLLLEFYSHAVDADDTISPQVWSKSRSRGCSAAWPLTWQSG